MKFYCELFMLMIAWYKLNAGELLRSWKVLVSEFSSLQIGSSFSHGKPTTKGEKGSWCDDVLIVFVLLKFHDCTGRKGSLSLYLEALWTAQDILLLFYFNFFCPFCVPSMVVVSCLVLVGGDGKTMEEMRSKVFHVGFPLQ